MRLHRGQFINVPIFNLKLKCLQDIKEEKNSQYFHKLLLEIPSTTHCLLASVGSRLTHHIKLVQ